MVTSPKDISAMSVDSSSSGVPFDLEKFRELVALMETHGLTQVDLKNGEQRWRLRRGPAEVVQMMPAAYPPPSYAAVPPSYAAASHAAATPPAPTAATPAIAADPGVTIKSPTVGTFYSANAPGEEPFASVGTKVTKDTVVCIIEAMKVMNQIPAEIEGTVTELLVKNGDAVEFNQPLFRVKVG